MSASISPLRLHCEHDGRPIVETLEIEKGDQLYLIRVCAPCLRIMDSGGTMIAKEGR